MVSDRLTVQRGSWCDLVDVPVAGDARIGGAGVRIAGSTIGGDLDVIGTQSAADPLSARNNIVCNSTVHGDLVGPGSGSAATWDIGQCGPNVIHGDRASPATTRPATQSRATPSTGTWCVLATADSHV